MPEKKRIRLLYIIPRLSKAGAEWHLFNLVRGLDKSKFEIDICCIKELGELGNDLMNTGIGVFCLSRKSIYDLRIILDIYKFMAQRKYHIVHSYLFGFDYLACIPARIARVKATISSRRELAVWKKLHHRIFGYVENMFSYKVIACSQAAKQFAIVDERLSPNKITTIYNGICLNTFNPRGKDIRIMNEFNINKNEIVIGMVTKFAVVKDVEAALKAFSMLCIERKDLRLLVVGDGHLRGKLKELVKQLDIDGKVIFTGLRNDVSSLLSVMDVFLLTSLIEGFPNAILEAMACSLPVVATRTGGIPEIVQEGQSGFLVEVKDYSGIAEALRKIINDKEAAMVMGRNGRKIVEGRFSVERMVNDYEKFYNLAFFDSKS